MKEIWKEIENHKGYDVSNFGRIRSYRNRNGKGYITTPRILKQSYTHGYPQVALDGKTQKVHRLVLQTFCPNINSEKNQCNHIDGNKANNRLSNLEWVTPSENTLHAYRELGVSPVINNEKQVIGVDENGVMYLFRSVSAAARQLGVYRNSIQESIKKGYYTSNKHRIKFSYI